MLIANMETKLQNSVSKWYNLYLFLFICIQLNEIALMIYAPNTLMEVVYIWKYYIPFVFDAGGK